MPLRWGDVSGAIEPRGRRRGQAGSPLPALLGQYQVLGGRSSLPGAHAARVARGRQWSLDAQCGSRCSCRAAALAGCGGSSRAAWMHPPRPTACCGLRVRDRRLLERRRVRHDGPARRSRPTNPRFWRWAGNGPRRGERRAHYAGGNWYAPTWRRRRISTCDRTAIRASCIDEGAFTRTAAARVRHRAP